MGSCGGGRYTKEVGKKGGCCGGSQGDGRSHRELAVVGRGTGLTCEEAGGEPCKNILVIEVCRGFTIINQIVEVPFPNQPHSYGIR